MDEVISVRTIAFFGLLLGAALGWIANRVRFCTMGAITDILIMGSWLRMRMWILAMATAILGTSILQSIGWFDVSSSIYTLPRWSWLSNLFGGLLFGIGMTLASGCSVRMLLRLGGGSLKALVVIVFMAISAYMTLKGLFAVPRVHGLESIAITLPVSQDIPSLLAHVIDISRDTALIVSTVLIVIAFMWFCFHDPYFRTFESLFGGIAIGILVVLGWVVTAHLGFVAEHPNTLEAAYVGTNSGQAESLSLVGPTAYGLELLILWSDRSHLLTFGIAVAIGVFLGALIDSLSHRSFRLESFHDEKDMLHHIIGGILMGFGGITAMGCTIGQGISGVSTLSIGSILAVLSMIVGSRLTLRWLSR